MGSLSLEEINALLGDSHQVTKPRIDTLPDPNRPEHYTSQAEQTIQSQFSQVNPSQQVNEHHNEESMAEDVELIIESPEIVDDIETTIPFADDHSDAQKVINDPETISKENVAKVRERKHNSKTKDTGQKSYKLPFFVTLITAGLLLGVGTSYHFRSLHQADLNNAKVVQKAYLSGSMVYEGDKNQSRYAIPVDSAGLKKGQEYTIDATITLKDQTKLKVQSTFIYSGQTYTWAKVVQ
jgi:hypothetical protein